FFGETLSTSQIAELCRDVLAEGLTHARDGADWAMVVSSVEKAMRDARLTMPPEPIRLALSQIAASSPLFPALEKLQEALQDMHAVLENQAERAETLEQCRVRALELLSGLEAWQAAARGEAPKQAGNERVVWVETYSSSLQLHQTPLSVAPIFSKQREGTPRAWIFTSATLAVKND